MAVGHRPGGASNPEQSEDCAASLTRLLTHFEKLKAQCHRQLYALKVKKKPLLFPVRAFAAPHC